MRRGSYGNFGRPLRLLENFITWQARQLALIEAGELSEADSKADFPEFLFGPISRSMWKGYTVKAAQWERYISVESVPDFRETRLRGLNGLWGIGIVGDHGEYPAMRRTEQIPAGIAVDTYGGVYSLTRQLIINDDTGMLLNRNPRDMGRAISRFIGETVIALLESNPTAPDGNPFFSTGRGNQVTTALSETSLLAAIAFGEAQVNDDGEKTPITYDRLVVKTPQMEAIARRILQSQFAGGVQNDTASNVFDKGTINPVPLVTTLSPENIIREPWLSDPNDWYLLADPDEIPSFSIAFLNGQREPFIGLKNPEVRNALGPGVDPYTFELDSVDFKVRHDFGVAPRDPKGAYRGVVA